MQNDEIIHNLLRMNSNIINRHLSSLPMPQPQINSLAESPTQTQSVTEYHKMQSQNPRYNEHTHLPVFEEDLDHPERNNGVFDLSHVHRGGPWVVSQLSHLNNVRGTMPNGWTCNVFKNIQILDLSHNGLTGTQLSPLCKSLYYQQINYKVLNLSHNRLNSDSVGEILWSIGNNPGLEPKFPHTIETLNLSNNQIDDQGAEYLNWHISSGSLKGTKHIDVSGNNITPKGQGFLAEALQAVGQAVTIVTVKIKEVSKESFKASIKGMLHIAKSNGSQPMKQYNIARKEAGMLLEI